MNISKTVKAFSLVAAVSSFSSYAEKPNVIIVLMDDMAYGEANCFRPADEQNTGFGLVKKSDGTTPISKTDSRILTPNLDKMAAEGIRYTSFYSGGPICGPARASLLQGMHTGNQDCSTRNNNSGFKMRAGDFTIGSMLQNHGYVTGVVGKYGQCGGGIGSIVSNSTIIDSAKTILPHKLGFDYVYGALDHVSGHTQFPGIDWPANNPEQKTYKGSTSKANGARIWEAYAGSTAPTKTANHELVEIVDTHVYECFQSGIGYAQDNYREKAEQFITDSVSDNKPFFLYLNPTNPHAGWFLPEAGSTDDNVDFSKGLTTDQSTASGAGVGSFKWYKAQHAARQASESGWEKSASTGYGSQQYAFSAYAAVISRVDRDLGRIRNHLEAQGVADNTIIIFTSDNGPSDEGGASVNAAFSTLLRGGKRSMYEGGLRMPTVVYAPPGIIDNAKIGTAVDQPGAFCDLLPTVADLTGYDKSSITTSIDGKSFAGTIDSDLPNETAQFHYWEDNSNGSKQTVRWGKWKAIRNSAGSATGNVELYDLESDVSETANVASANSAIVDQMKRFMNESHVEGDGTNGIVPAFIESDANRLVYEQPAAYMEDFDSIAENVTLIATDGSTTINSVKYTGSIASTPSGSYQTQIKEVDSDGYISIWCEKDTKGDITWNADGSPAKTVSMVEIDIPDNTQLTNVSLDISRLATSNWWWYRVQYKDSADGLWKSVKQVSNYQSAASISVNENLSVTADALRVAVWRHGNNDPAEFAIDNISYSSPQVKDTVTLELNGNYVDTSFSGVLGSTSRAVSAWIKTSITNATIVSWGKGAAGEQMILIVENSTGKLRLEAASGARVVNTPALNDGNWHHVAFSFDNTIGTNLNAVKFYIDGIEATDTTANTRGINTSDLNKIRIGTDVNKGRKFTGSIDELAIFDRALTGTEISNIHSLGRGKFHAAGNDAGSSTLISDDNLHFYYDASTRKSGKPVVITDGDGLAVEASFIDGATTSAPAEFTATNDQFSTGEQSFTTSDITVLGNDSSIPANSTLSWATYTVPKLGTLSSTDNLGNFTYSFVVAPTTNGESDTFSYMITDPVTGANEIAEATVTFDDTLTPAIGVEVTQTDNLLEWTVEDEINVKEYLVIDADGNVVAIVSADNSGKYSVVLDSDEPVSLVVVDNSGHKQTFRPEDGNEQITTYDLKEGWNLIAITSEDANLEELKNETVGVVWGWDDSSYKVVESAEPTDAIWVYSSIEKQVDVKGRKSDKKLSLNIGWNMIGPVENSYIPEGADTVYTWEDVYNIVAGEDKVLIEGVGYWIFSL